MLLAVDVGNTHTTLGLFDGEELVDHWRVASEPRRTADDLALLVAGLLARRPAGPADPGAPASSPDSPPEVTGLAICAVVPGALHELRAMAARHYPGVPAVVVEPGVRTGVPILIDNPREVGADRICNVIAAVHLVGGPAVIVDFGTSTTFDAVSAKGEYLGGAIAPGIEVSVEALGARGAQLRRVEIARPRSVIGKGTVEALQSGILYGFAGQVDGVVERMQAELGPATTVLATGALAHLVLAETRCQPRHEPWLTLVGLRLLFDRNHPSSKRPRGTTA